MKFRGNDRRLLSSVAKALDRIIKRDVKWAARNPKTSRMADVAILPVTDAALVAAVNVVSTRMAFLKSL